MNQFSSEDKNNKTLISAFDRGSCDTAAGETPAVTSQMGAWPSRAAGEEV